MTGWTTPITWQDQDLVTANLMNQQLRDNLNALKAPPTASHECDETGDYQTSNGTFVDVDATNLALTITTAGGDVLVHFHGTLVRSSEGYVYFDIDVDGSRVGGDDGVSGARVRSVGNIDTAISFTRLINGLPAGDHTFKLQWKSGSTATLLAGAGTSHGDLHPQFWVREVS